MNQLIFLPVPENFKKQINSSGDAFPVDPAIPIPVEIPQENAQTCIANLSMDMIIHGMLRAIEERQVKKEWIDYYSNFILFLCPEILEICQDEISKKNF
ncbi:MAG: hypothetical protein FWD40_05090 [Treponema sp.]|nr:hypothetical protein [Treponema sp.]